MDKIKELRKNISGYDNLEIAKSFFQYDFGGKHRERRFQKNFDLITKYINDFHEGIRVLDIGCSGGRYTQMLLQKKMITFGLDTSRIALKFNKEHNPEANLIQCSVTNLPFVSQSFDLIVCVELFHHLDDHFLDQALKDLSRILKKGGTFFCDLRNSLNPIMWYSYKKRNGKYYTLKTRNIFTMIKNIEKHNFKVYEKKGFYFPITEFAPYIILSAKKINK
jgi:SAM-dependent methyltransferase